MDTVSFFNYGFNKKGGGNHLKGITDSEGNPLKRDKSVLAITEYMHFSFSDTLYSGVICNGQRDLYCTVSDDRLKKAVGKKKAKLNTKNVFDIALLNPICLMSTYVMGNYYYIGLSKIEKPTTLEQLDYFIEVPNKYTSINIELENLSDYYIQYFFIINCINYYPDMDEVCQTGCGELTATFIPPEIEFS